MKIDSWQRGLLVMLIVGIALLFGSVPASATHDPFPLAPAGSPWDVGDACHDFSK
jgi:hypothetical protein